MNFSLDSGGCKGGGGAQQARAHPSRTAFSNWLLARPIWFIEDLATGDDATFCMNSSLNTHNIRQYAPRGQLRI